MFVTIVVPVARQRHCLDPLNALDESHTQVQSDLSTSDYHSFVAPADASVLIDASPTQKKMFDITDLLGSSPFDDKQEASHWFEKLQPLSASSPTLDVVDYLRAQAFKFDQDLHDKHQWQMEQNHLKYGVHVHLGQGRARHTRFTPCLGSKQLSPTDYLTRQSLYNRPVAFEKDSRTWARSLLDKFKNSTHPNSINSSINFSYIEHSPSFDQHIQYIEHLNECNDYPGYLEYLHENRSELFYTLTDSLDIIDGLLGTVVSSF